MTEEFKKTFAVSEIDSNQAKKIDINGRELAIVNCDGEFYAIDDLCTHADASLSEGCVENGEIECPLHFARFKIKTGEVTEPPAFEDLKTYETKIEDGYIFVKI